MITAVYWQDMWWLRYRELSLEIWIWTRGWVREFRSLFTVFSECHLYCVCVLSHFNCVQLFATPRTTAFQAPLSMGFSWQEYWSGLPFPPPGDLSHPGIKPASPAHLLQCGQILYG